MDGERGVEHGSGLGAFLVMEASHRTLPYPTIPYPTLEGKDEEDGRTESERVRGRNRERDRDRDRERERDRDRVGLLAGGESGPLRILVD